jgi:hypothetical protein
MPAPRRIFGNDTADDDGRDFSTTAQPHSPRATALYSYHKVRYPEIDHYRKCSLAKAHPHDKLGFPDREPSAQFGGGRSSELAGVGKNSAHFADNTRKATHKNCERTATLGDAGFAADAFLSEVAAGCGAGHVSTAYRRKGRYDSTNRVGQLGAAARAGTEMVTGGGDAAGAAAAAAAAAAKPASAQDRHAATRRCRAEAAAIRAARGAQTLATLRVAHYGSGDASANAFHGGFETNYESANATNLPWKAERKPALPSRFASTAPLPANLVARQSAANYGQNPTPSSAYKSFCDRGGHTAPGQPARRGPNRGTFGIPGCSASSSSAATAMGSPEDAEMVEEEGAEERRASRGGRARYQPPPPPPLPQAARQGAVAAALSGEEALLRQLGALMQRSHGSLYEILLGAAPLRPVPGAPLPLEVRVGVDDVPRILQRLRAQGLRMATAPALCDLIAACSAGAQTAAIRQLQTAVRRTRVHAATRKDVARARWHGQIMRDGPKVNSGAPKKIRL